MVKNAVKAIKQLRPPRPSRPLRPSLRSAEEKTWQSQGHRLNSRRAEIVEEKANAERFTVQREEDYRTRGSQELFIVTRNKVEADPRYKALMTERASINSAIRDHKKQQEREQDMNRGRSR
jgi:hypothetical protein